MREDRSIPDHVNDNVPVDEVDRYERFEAALAAVGDEQGAVGEYTPVGADARRVWGPTDNSLARMRRTAFINAAIQNNPAIIKKLRASFHGVTDLQRLVDAVRLEVVIRRLE